MNPGSTQPVQLAMLINMLSIGSPMMVMPLGPDFVRELGMAAEHIGYIAGGATLASALSAAACAAWLDRLERKRALVVLLALRFALLLACAGVTSAGQLILLFVLSGLVAGPMGAVLMASLLDLIPPAERGRKLAHVAMGFSLAAILVTPAALELSRLWGWRMPFLLFGGLGLALAVACIALFPSPPRHPRLPASLLPLLRTPLCLGALALVALQMAGHFLLVPHFANFFEFNLGFARDQLGLLYLCGGLASIASMRIGGGLIDRGHAAAVALTSSGLLALVTLLGFVLLAPLPLFVTFALFMRSARYAPAAPRRSSPAYPHPTSGLPSWPCRAPSPTSRPGSAAWPRPVTSAPTPLARCWASNDSPGSMPWRAWRQARASWRCSTHCAAGRKQPPLQRQARPEPAAAHLMSLTSASFEPQRSMQCPL